MGEKHVSTIASYGEKLMVSLQIHASSFQIHIWYSRNAKNFILKKIHTLYKQFKNVQMAQLQLHTELASQDVLKFTRNPNSTQNHFFVLDLVVGFEPFRVVVVVVVVVDFVASAPFLLSLLAFREPGGEPFGASGFFAPSSSTDGVRTL